MQPEHNAVRHVLRSVTFVAHHSLEGVKMQNENARCTHRLIYQLNEQNLLCHSI